VVTFNAPNYQAIFYAKCTVSDTEGNYTTDSILLLVKDPELAQTGELVAKYNFQGDAADYSGYNHNGTVSNCQFTDDWLENPNSAVYFNQSNSKIIVQNTDELNFTEGISVCLWINIAQHYDRESYPVSHGNWQNRWKISIGSQKLRFTIKGDNGYMDLDSKSVLEQNEWYHVVVLYNGWDCELYINGELESVKLYEGLIHTTNYDLVFGQHLPDQTGFNFKGKLDKVKIYNYGISYDLIQTMYQQELTSVISPESEKYVLDISPNIASQFVQYKLAVEPGSQVNLSLLNNYGSVILNIPVQIDSRGFASSGFNVSMVKPGLYFLKLSWNNNQIVRRLVVNN